jgi:hypothetical protein
MNNNLKEFEELLPDNMLLKVQNQASGNKNPEWKEWWQTIQEFMEEKIKESMELACFNEQSYQLELQVYRIIFLDFKYESSSFVIVEIGTSNRTPTTPSLVQHVATTKPINPLRGGTCLESIPLLFRFFFVPIQVIIATTKLVDSSDKSIQEHVEHVDLSFTVFDIGTDPLEFLLVTLPLTPHQIGIG